MANIRALAAEDLYYFNTKYKFELIDNKYILVYCSNYPNRKTIHPIDEGFSITSKKRKLKITKRAIDLWINKYKDTYSLVDVQNSLSSLVVSYQDITDDSIDEQLKRKTLKIKEN